ncbi:MAG: hypothetical protein ACM3ZE_01710 [Myxococcales bacterium]
MSTPRHLPRLPVWEYRAVLRQSGLAAATQGCETELLSILNSFIRPVHAQRRAIAARWPSMSLRPRLDAISSQFLASLASLAPGGESAEMHSAQVNMLAESLAHRLLKPF